MDWIEFITNLGAGMLGIACFAILYIYFRAWLEAKVEQVYTEAPGYGSLFIPPYVEDVEFTTAGRPVLYLSEDCPTEIITSSSCDFVRMPTVQPLVDEAPQPKPKRVQCSRCFEWRDVSLTHCPGCGAGLG